MNNKLFNRGVLALALTGSVLPACSQEKHHPETAFCVSCGDDQKLETISQRCHDLLNETVFPERIAIKEQVNSDEKNTSTIYTISDGQHVCSCERTVGTDQTTHACDIRLEPGEISHRAIFNANRDGLKEFQSYGLNGQTVLTGRFVNIAPNGTCTENLYGGFRTDKSPASQEACKQFFAAHSQKLTDLFQKLQQKNDQSK
jgi:hypothetical protein